MYLYAENTHVLVGQKGNYQLTISVTKYWNKFKADKMFRAFLIVIRIVFSKTYIKMVNSEDNFSFGTTLPIDTIVLFSSSVVSKN